LTIPENLSEFQTLVEIFALLRSPQGCPWDRKQTHTTLRENLLEETYEVLQTLDEGEAKKLCEELGDLLMQIIFHAQIASEAGEFDIGDVIKNINAKLIHRHPHIFGSTKAETAEDVAHNWETLKKKERAEGTSILSGVPRQMPALAYSKTIQWRAAQVGFDWPDIDGVIDKLSEEIKEFQQAKNQEEKASEFGDILFTLVNIARRMGIDPESALRETNGRFTRRFMSMEKVCHERGLDLSKMSLDELNSLWEEAKQKSG
jgi:tetrapyrrole methylase family protein / MazG family protein